jgi:hypothetical protein
MAIALLSQNYQDNVALGNWVSAQRQKCKRPDRITQLNAIGFCWDVSEALWNKNVRRTCSLQKDPW